MAVAGSDGAGSGRAVDVRSTLQRMRRRGGLPVAFGGLFSGSRQFRISELTGTTTNSLRGLAITPGNGLGGKVLTMSRPISVADYPTSRAISHEYDAAVGAEGLRSMLAVPVVVRGQVRGVLYGALRQPLVLGDRALGSAVETARELERALEHELARELAARDEAQWLLAEARRRRLRGQPRCAPPAEETDSAVWEEVREAHGDLRALAHRVPDPQLRAEILTACGRLARASSGRGRERERPGGRSCRRARWTCWRVWRRGRRIRRRRSGWGCGRRRSRAICGPRCGSWGPTPVSTRSSRPAGRGFCRRGCPADRDACGGLLPYPPLPTIGAPPRTPLLKLPQLPLGGAPWRG
ncbi:hypothetical protein SVIO_080620 [Streptomyces violaceusniger]|uniref:GAF domain-containing protein n=1 Tax=Streptomyces violaceusniger TaxID=68280 RepID=A0A4D4LHR3_STRVO|nr:hypothetical protein SVIO_080620 [Streptomyces violaceusniger]